jgi:hypothetical protein
MRNKKNLLSFLVALLICFSHANGQKRNASNTNQDKEPPLAPLTEAERALDLRSIIANQPDFTADQSFFYGEGFGGFGASQRIARRGNKYRWDNGFIIVIGEPGKAATRLYPKAKVSDDIETGIDEESIGAGRPFNPKTLASGSEITFTALGTLTIDGHKCIKIQAIRKNSPEKIFLYAAEDLKYLVIVAQVLNRPRGSIQKLSNISLDVPDNLFEIPSDYKAIEHRRWTRLDNAKLTYGGKPCQNFSVYRSETGELFIAVNEPCPDWTYLVRLKRGNSRDSFSGYACNAKRGRCMANE